MAERPILFNTQMVKAILEGLKTQTRRIIKGLPLYEPYFEVDEGRGFLMDSEDGQFYALENFSKVQPRDVLWVRETWQRLSDFGEKLYVHRADYEDNEPLKLDGMYTTWRPSIHMPREAARLFLFVKHVRAERLQTITIEEIKAEGLTSAAVHAGDKEIAFEEFKLLWNSSIKKADLPRYGWEANPWVWVYEFEVQKEEATGMEATRDFSLSDMMRIRAEAKRNNLRVNGQALKRDMLKLIELIDAGEWEAFDVRRGEITKSGDVEVFVTAIREEMARRDRILYYARLQLGGYKA